MSWVGDVGRYRRRERTIKKKGTREVNVERVNLVGRGTLTCKRGCGNVNQNTVEEKVRTGRESLTKVKDNGREK